MKDNLELIIVTGISGAGKTLALRVLEDLNYYCLDNLPPQLFPDFIQLCSSEDYGIKKIAISTDIRGQKFLSKFFSSIDIIRKMNVHPTTVFIEARSEVLVRRFSETRRKHPLDSNKPILENIEEEKSLMKNIREYADIIIDTSNFKWMDLRNEIINIFYKGEVTKKTKILIVSFGFKHGVPLDTDLMFDLRFLPNPHYVEHLKDNTGETDVIEEYLLSYDVTKEFMEKLTSFLLFVVPQYITEEKRYLTISFGCTGGKHRSVYFARKIAELLEEKKYSVYLKHRDRQYWK
ncbi:RNase adapter RapZ [bacterium]|nr:RNase adapter RapZ [bacterium]